MHLGASRSFGHRNWLVSLVLLCALLQHRGSAWLGEPDRSRSTIDRAAASGTDGLRFKKPPLRFEINAGQTDPQVRFMARADDTTLFLTPSESVLHLRTRGPKAADRSAVVRLRPLRADISAQVRGINRLPGVSNYFIGNDPGRWRTNVESYAGVKYEGIYPGIDLIYYGNEAGEIEYDFKVAAGGDPRAIAMSVEGADTLEVDQPTGDLILQTAVGPIRQHAPLVYQEINGTRRSILARYALTRDNRPGTEVAFDVGDYDTDQPLIIDPVVVYATLLGGATGDVDGVNDLAVDRQGNAYVTGYTESGDFPTKNPIDPVPPARNESKAFISKFAPDGSLVFSTFFGSNDNSSTGSAIAVDAQGAIYVGGSAGPGFPLKNAFQPTQGSFSDAFITKLSPDGASIVYSSFLGGNRAEHVKDLALDAERAVYIIGEIEARDATSVTFPTVSPIQSAYGGGDRDGFLSVIAPGGASLLQSTFLDFGTLRSPAQSGGDDEMTSIGLSSHGDVFVSGKATLQSNTDSERVEVFVARFGPLSASPSRFRPQVFEMGMLIRADQMFSSPEDRAWAKLAYALMGADPWNVDNPAPGENARPQAATAAALPLLLVGYCHPVPPATTCNEPAAFGLLDRDLKIVAAANVKGGREFFLDAFRQDSKGALYVVGDTLSTRLQTVNPTQASSGGLDDAVVAVYSSETFEPVFVTYLGGDGVETPTGIAVDVQGNIFVTGTVYEATRFPTTPGAFQRDIKGSNDVFLVKISAVFP